MRGGPCGSALACGISLPDVRVRVPRHLYPSRSALLAVRCLPTATGGGKASAKLPQFTAVNTLLGNLNPALTGTYHAFDFAKYAHRYLAEAQYRFNRRFNLASILARLLRAASVTLPQPAPFIRLAEECR